MELVCLADLQRWTRPSPASLGIVMDDRSLLAVRARVL